VCVCVCVCVYVCGDVCVAAHLSDMDETTTSSDMAWPGTSRRLPGWSRSTPSIHSPHAHPWRPMAAAGSGSRGQATRQSAPGLTQAAGPVSLVCGNRFSALLHAPVIRGSRLRL